MKWIARAVCFLSHALLVTVLPEGNVALVFLVAVVVAISAGAGWAE